MASWVIQRNSILWSYIIDHVQGLFEGNQISHNADEDTSKSAEPVNPLEARKPASTVVSCETFPVRHFLQEFPRPVHRQLNSFRPFILPTIKIGPITIEITIQPLIVSRMKVTVC